MKLSKKHTLGGILSTEKKAYEYGKLAALDVFATMAASVLLYVGSRFFANNRSPEKQAQLEARANAGKVLLDDAMAPLPVHTDAPQTTVSGDKVHPGLIAQPAAEQQLSV